MPFAPNRQRISCVLCLLLVFVYSTIASADQLYLAASPPRYVPGSSFEVLVSLANDSTRQGLQFDVTCDPIQARPVSARLLGRLRTGVQLFTSEVPPGTFHVLIYDPSATRNSIPAGADTAIAVDFATFESSNQDIAIQILDPLSAADALTPVAISPTGLDIKPVTTSTFVQTFQARAIENGAVLINWALATDDYQTRTNVYRAIPGQQARVRVNDQPFFGPGPHWLTDYPPNGAGTILYELDLATSTGETPLATVEIQAVQTLPSRFALYQNRPNPFSSSTTIQFDVAREGRVKLAVYSVEGRLVRVLQEQAVPPGRYSLRWDGRGDAGEITASGIYFIRAETGSQGVVKKIIRMK